MLPAEPRLRGITEQHGRRPVLTGRGPEAASVIQELTLRLVVFGEAGGRLRVDLCICGRQTACLSRPPTSGQKRCTLPSLQTETAISLTLPPNACK